MENAMCKFLLNYAPLYRKNYFGLKVVSYYIFGFGWFHTLGLKSRNFGIPLLLGPTVQGDAEMHGP